MPQNRGVWFEHVVDNLEISVEGELLLRSILDTHNPYLSGSVAPRNKSICRFYRNIISRDFFVDAILAGSVVAAS